MENLDLTQILKDCPKGTKLYSPLFGEVEFIQISTTQYYPILVRAYTGDIGNFTRNGRYYNCEDGECMLFPSKEQRDWSKFKVSKPDLPIDTPVMVKSEPDIMWHFRYYAGNGTTYINGNKSVDCKERIFWDNIIPFDKFNPDNIEGSIKNFNYGTKLY